MHARMIHNMKGKRSPIPYGKKGQVTNNYLHIRSTHSYSHVVTSNCYPLDACLSQAYLYYTSHNTHCFRTALQKIMMVMFIITSCLIVAFSRLDLNIVYILQQYISNQGVDTL